LGADGGLYYSIEFAGPGVHHLSLESRMVIPNSMAEIGAKNAYLPPDVPVFEYLAARSGQTIEQLRARALYPDEDADYAAEYDLFLDRLEPLVACPHSIEKVQPLSALAGQKVDLAFIGTCTNGRLEDLAAAADVLRGQHVHPQTRLIIIPASQQVLQAALQQGILTTLVEAGAMIGVPGCGPCMGNHLGIPAAGEVVISTANRNFKGRMGQPEAEIYLASPAVVAASAVLGRIASPLELEGKAPPARGATEPALGTVRQSERHFTTPTSRRQVAGTPQPHGRVWKYGDNVNTDQIFPGKYTYTANTPEEIAAHALEDLDPAFAGAVQAGDVIVGGVNFGCGSSREQAVTCLKYKGVRAIVARSFARIFYRNALNQGLAAIVCPEAVDAARNGDAVEIDLAAGVIRLPAGDFVFPPFPEHVRAILEAGGLVAFVKAGTLQK
jgi:3-isopropylmalate dehydratase small subunit